jgi:hypothetical protein
MAPTQLVWRIEMLTPVVRRLCRDFAALSPETVEWCVSDVRLRAQHLGLDLGPQLVELVAREHLACMVMSEPPSPRRAEPSAGE